MSDQIQQLAQWVKEAEQIAFFGGAGVSTESQIPDFRSEQGLFRAEQKYGYPPEIMLSHSFFLEHPREFYRYYFQEMIYPSAQPNAAHRSLAKLEEMGKLSAVITQNIDGLHQKAGSHKVLELHGSVLRNYCMNCGLKFSLDYMLEHRDSVPHCPDCGGMIRPDVVLYEEALDDTLMKESKRILGAADMLIVGGTSLTVYPAAGLLRWFHGNRLVVINKGEISLNKAADMIIQDSIGKTLEQVLKTI